MAEPHLREDGKDHSDRARALIDSALRTLEAEAGGIAALAAAIRDGLGRPFVAAVELIRAAKGRVIVTGMGKSGHVGRKIAATLRLDRHARFLRASRRGEPRRSRHDHRPTTSSWRCRGRARPPS